MYGSQQNPPDFAAWLSAEMRQRGYNREQRGGPARFARDVGIPPAVLSRLLSGDGLPDIRTARAIARHLSYPITRVLIAAGLITADETDSRNYDLTRTDHLNALVNGDTAAADAVIAVLRATGHWP